MQAPTPANRDNNFDFLRFFAAAMVVFGHSYGLSGQAHQEPLRLFSGSYDSADIAVHVFFVMSGFLIAGSWLNSHSVLDFAAKRALRILPALIVSVLFVVLVVGPLATELSLSEYFAAPGTLAYLSNAVLITEFRLPGVFESNPFAYTVNGSLWTLPYEVLMYVTVLTLGLLKVFGRSMALVGLVLMVGVHFYLIPIYEVQSDLLRKATRLGMFFYAGVVFYLYRQRLVWSWKIAALLVGANLLSARSDYWELVHVLTVPYLTLYLAQLRIPRLAGFGKAGDFSYGLYIFSFPIQQLIMHWTEGQLPLLPFMALGFTASLIAALLSWHLIESPAMALKRYLPRRRRSTATAVATANR
ncbi:acyltransferase [Pseudomonas stutzeri]|uniref:Acyltransferase n=1 Tax=Stutzerimonas stutzeri TaxID=316 RepID=A0A2N8RZ40_STUST|nr:acyltransferase [Stutzerimonas stutzeri]MCQ4297518.1 acyltransferase [Stutzerimonas stutzeri]PNF79654.1 acyltransferase [Stutzerimonas stutzeri]